MMLIIFDLDGTLASIGQPIMEKTLQSMRELERRGIRIALCSGKPVYYLCGVMRQAGLQSPILLGENGASMQLGIDLPPRVHYTLPYSQAARDSIRLIRSELEKRLPQLWYQPNQVGLTPFFSTQEENAAIGQCLQDLADRISDVDIYPQVDCYDVTPKGISKAEGIRALGRFLGISTEDMTAVGDGINDYPMFEAAGFSIGIRLKEAGMVDRNVESIDEAMELLTGSCQASADNCAERIERSPKRTAKKVTNSYENS